MTYTITYTTTFTIAHNMPDFTTRPFDTVEEAIKWMDGLQDFMQGIDTVVCYEIHAA